MKNYNKYLEIIGLEEEREFYLTTIGYNNINKINSILITTDMHPIIHLRGIKDECLIFMKMFLFAKDKVFLNQPKT